MAEGQYLVVSPVLFCAPVFWLEDYWADSAHQWDGVHPETPLNEKPQVEIEISLDVTLGEVIETSCDEWGIVAGPGMHRQNQSRIGEFYRFGFVNVDTDADGVEASVGYGWPKELPIARLSGNVELVPALQITYEELLISSRLGLISGDIAAPYVHPVRPQGAFGSPLELAHLTAEAIQTAYRLAQSEYATVGHVLRLIRSAEPRARDIVTSVPNAVATPMFYWSIFGWFRRRKKDRKHDK